MLLSFKTTPHAFKEHNPDRKIERLSRERKHQQRDRERTGRERKSKGITLF